MLENYKVVLVEADFYASNAINSYLAWDRRTRVTHRCKHIDDLLLYLAKTIAAELPDTILLDASLLLRPKDVDRCFAEVHRLCAADLIVMTRYTIPEIGKAVYAAGGKGYVVREDVGLQVSWMIPWSKAQSFITTPQTAPLFPTAAVLPDGREYPELTDRVRQALMLCVVEGMSAELAADEMGLSPHTIRTYIKEGYSILESYDSSELPATLSPQEKAFMRFTALSLEKAKAQKK